MQPFMYSAPLLIHFGSHPWCGPIMICSSRTIRMQLTMPLQGQLVAGRCTLPMSRASKTLRFSGPSSIPTDLYNPHRYSSKSNQRLSFSGSGTGGFQSIKSRRKMAAWNNDYLLQLTANPKPAFLNAFNLFLN